MDRKELGVNGRLTCFYLLQCHQDRVCVGVLTEYVVFPAKCDTHNILWFLTLDNHISNNLAKALLSKLLVGSTSPSTSHPYGYINGHVFIDFLLLFFVKYWVHFPFDFGRDDLKLHPQFCGIVRFSLMLIVSFDRIYL